MIATLLLVAFPAGTLIALLWIAGGTGPKTPRRPT